MFFAFQWGNFFFDFLFLLFVGGIDAWFLNLIWCQFQKVLSQLINIGLFNCLLLCQLAQLVTNIVILFLLFLISKFIGYWNSLKIFLNFRWRFEERNKCVNELIYATECIRLFWVALNACEYDGILASKSISHRLWLKCSIYLKRNGSGQGRSELCRIGLDNKLYWPIIESLRFKKDLSDYSLNWSLIYRDYSQTT